MRKATNRTKCLCFGAYLSTAVTYTAASHELTNTVSGAAQRAAFTRIDSFNMAQEKIDRLRTRFENKAVSLVEAKEPYRRAIRGAGRVAEDFGPLSGAVLKATNIASKIPLFSAAVWAIKEIANTELGIPTEFIKRGLLELKKTDEAFIAEVNNLALPEAERARLVYENVTSRTQFAQRMLDTATSEEAKDAIRNDLAEASARTVIAQGEFLERLQAMTQAEVIALERKMQIQDNKYLELSRSVGEQGRSLSEMATGFQDLRSRYQTFAARVSETVANNTRTIGELSNGVARLGSVVVQHDRILTEYGEVIDNQGNIIGRHEMRLDTVEGLVVDLDAEMNKIADDVAFNQDLLFGALPNSEKLRALKNPRFLYQRFKTPEDRANAIEKLQLQIVKEDIAKAATDFANGLQDVAKITANLGLGSEKDQERIQEIIHYASVASDLARDYATGNYLGMAVTVSGIVSNKSTRPDPEQVRFEAIMGALRQIDQRLELIDQKIDRVIELQQATLEAIFDLDRSMYNRFRTLKSDLDVIAWEQQVIKQLVIDTGQLPGDLIQCELFLAGRNVRSAGRRTAYNAPPFVNFAVGEFDTWDALESHFNSNSTDYGDCRNGIRRLFAPGHRNSLLLMQTYSINGGQQGWISNFIRPTYLPLLNIATSHFGSGSNVFYALGNPSVDFANLRRKSFLANGTIDDAVNQMANLAEFLHPVQLQYYTYMLVELMMYDGIVNLHSSTLRTPDEVLTNETYDPATPLAHLNTALWMVNLAIAQQALLNGDIVIPILHNKLFSKRTTGSTRNDILKALGTNPTLAQNYLVSRLTEEMKYAGRISGNAESYNDRFEKNIAVYAAVYKDASRCGELDNIFTTDWRVDLSFLKSSIECDGSGIFIKLDNAIDGVDNIIALLELPHPESLSNKTYAFRKETDELIDLRNKLLDYALLNYESVSLSNLYHLFGNTLSNRNTPPVFLSDRIQVMASGDTLRIPLDVYDVEGDAVNSTIVSEPTTGSASISDGELTYSPNDGFVGEDQVEILLDDGDLKTTIPIMIIVGPSLG